MTSKVQYPKLTAEILEGFVASCLAKGYDEATKIPAFHKELWSLFCEDHPNVAIASPRGHAKTTAGTQAFSLASVLFRNRKYVLIVADTETQAAQFLGDIKTALSDNEDIHAMFGMVRFVRDTNTDFICEFEDGWQFRMQAKGAGQKLRGLKWDNLRPDLICLDDLENDQDVMNEESRKKLQRWFYGALVPCRSKSGIIRYVGTILHMDSLLENLMSKYKLKYIDELRAANRDRRNAWLLAKYKAHNADYSCVLWPERYPADYWKTLREDFRKDGLGDVYNQEYLNLPIDETTAYFRRGDLMQMTEEDYKRHLTYYVGVDLAISEKQTADYSAFVVAGMDERGTLYIVDVLRERLDSLEIVDRLIGLQRKYRAELVAAGNDQISKSIGPVLREEMLRSGVFLNFHLLPQHQDKVMRARNVQARIRAGSIRFDKECIWYDALEEELLTFPRGKHDDQVDALAHIGMALDSLVPAETEEELEEDLYETEFGSSFSNPTYHGANSICGY